jgi:hypothetical protein
MRPILVGVLALAILTTTSCTRTEPTHSTESELFLLSKPEENGLSMDALFRGPFVVREGCVLIGQPGAYAVPIWWKGFTAERNGSGRLVVSDGEGAMVAVEGETFEMGGGYVAEFRPRGKVEARDDQLRRLKEWLGYPIPERCLAPDVYGVWSVGDW